MLKVIQTFASLEQKEARESEAFSQLDKSATFCKKPLPMVIEICLYMC